jgi:uncharacterized protein YqgC (DUF456 family)
MCYASYQRITPSFSSDANNVTPVSPSWLLLWVHLPVIIRRILGFLRVCEYVLYLRTVVLVVSIFCDNLRTKTFSILDIQ